MPWGEGEGGQVTAEDIRQVARRYFHEDTLVVVVVRPRQSAAPTETSTETVPAEPVVKKVLGNSITLLLKRNPALPIVTMQAYFKGGVRVETGGAHDAVIAPRRVAYRAVTTAFPRRA